ncbi:adenylyl-sulfate kinase [Burkholderia gladioli]|uniref:adenylyl-sulfate kinase n=1 Tax=Burkholderia gladioli TaxID=28095 RepID=UPI0016415DB1|nr:adenylyl-sulfate kinase [Burkholderia gladioli]MDN7602883.1 adenylyl-sulfate kinase [Burkholderia gladioli]URV24125.1 adenylyl-sulfate kinase [Burkholderia gladioli]
MSAQNIVETSRCYWLTGLSGAGKTTLARKFADQLRSKGISALILDGDTLRARLNQDLGFSRDDRAESVRRAAEISRIAVDSGLTVIASLVSPYAKDRQAASESVGEDRFIEVFVDASLDTCVRRDPKGLYRRAQAGLISNFTGIDDPYERPVAPALHILTDDCPDVEGVELLLAHFENRLPLHNSRDI